MKSLTFMFSILAMLSVTACGTDYKEEHAEVDKRQAQEMIEDADRVEVEDDTIHLIDD